MPVARRDVPRYPSSFQGRNNHRNDLRATIKLLTNYIETSFQETSLVLPYNNSHYLAKAISSQVLFR
jgi:hypothetical protein